MIRRQDGNDWLLISQLDHAQVAADVAAAWDGTAVAPLPFRDLLLPAIRHHDDGWEEWEALPTIDPLNGKPRDFTEMLLPVALDIWMHSIARCADLSPQAGLWVSRHFCYLAEHAMTSHKDNAAERTALQSFLRIQQSFQSESWASVGEPLTAEHIETGFRHVQFFDRVSLWICCARRDKPTTMTTPAGESMQFTPRGATTIAVAPSAFTSSVELSVTARRIPARSYDDDHDLQTALQSAPPERLTWTLRNAED